MWVKCILYKLGYPKCDEIIIKKLVTKINNTKFFSILADKTTDIPTIEQFSLCVRFVDFTNVNEYKIVGV